MLLKVPLWTDIDRKIWKRAVQKAETNWTWALARICRHAQPTTFRRKSNQQVQHHGIAELDGLFHFAAMTATKLRAIRRLGDSRRRSLTPSPA